MIDFGDARLVAKYGSWVAVQTEFYDFLYKTAAQLRGKHFNAGGGGLYEQTKRAIEKTFPTQEAAWAAFLEEIGAKVLDK